MKRALFIAFLVGVVIVVAVAASAMPTAAGGGAEPYAPSKRRALGSPGRGRTDHRRGRLADQDLHFVPELEAPMYGAEPLPEDAP